MTKALSAKRARAAARRSRARQQRTEQQDWERCFDAISDCVTLHDNEFTIVRANQAFQELFPQVVPGQTKCYKLVHGLDAPPHYCPARKTLEGKQTGVCEFFSPALGRQFFVSTDPILGSQGELTGFVHIAQDITQSKRTEETLRQTTEKLHAVIRASPVAIVALDAEGRVTLWNRAAERVFGWTDVEVLGHPLPFVPPEKEAETRDLRERVLRGESLTDVELLRRRRDGTEIHISLSTAPLRDSQGQAVGILGVMADISERKQAEQELRESQRALSTLMQNLPGMAYRCRSDPKCTMDFVSEGATRLTGYQPAELVGNRKVSYAELIHPDDRETVREEMQAALRAREPFQFTYRIQTARGEECHVWEQGQGVFAPEGELLALEGFIADITAQRQAEEALQQSEERFHKAFQSSPDAISITTVAEGRYLEVNEGFLRLTGYQRAEVIGRTTADLNIWAEEKDRARLVAHLRDRGRVSGWEINFRVKSGEVRTGLISADIIELGGERCLLTLARDITEARFLEEQLRQAQRMEAVGQLAGGVAHDFNNLLMVISGHGDLLQTRLGADHRVERHLQEMQKAVKRAGALTRQLLAFSRKQVLQPVVLDLNLVVADTETMLHRLIGEHIELSTSLEPALGRIRADPGQLEQVIVNLAVNARDAMPEGGKLTLETANADLDPAYCRHHPPVQPGSYVVLAVADTGSGMDKQTQAHIFEPFFTTKEEGKGTGLGLATVYGIVKQSGGYIWVYSEPEHGTTFKIYFPRVEESGGVVRAAEQASTPARGAETVLLVEDEEPLRALTRELLEMRGYQVLEAQNGQEALALAARHPGTIHLLLTDVVLPKMTGPQLAGKLAAQLPGLKTLFMSGYSQEAAVQHGLVTAEHKFLQKPFTLDTLGAKVRGALEGPEEASGSREETGAAPTAENDNFWSRLKKIRR